MIRLLKFVFDSVPALGVSMPGPRLSSRIAHIACSRTPQEISRTRSASLVISLVVLSSVFATGTLARAHQSDGQPTTSGKRPKFEVASVKPCDPSGRRGGDTTWSPGRITVDCQSARVFIVRAYIEYASGQQEPGLSLPESHVREVVALRSPILGAPSWIDSAHFTISAETPEQASMEMMLGPMMQSLLEDRFHLKSHGESKEVPAYDLVATKGGPKLPQTNPEAICRNGYDPKTPPRKPGDPYDCVMIGTNVTTSGLASRLGLAIGRPVIDKTAITGNFAIRMTYSDPPGVRPEAWPPNTDGAPSVFTALKEQLGLELVASKGSEKTLVIDHIEEPSPN